jgi:hypothetical protein
MTEDEDLSHRAHLPCSRKPDEAGCARCAVAYNANALRALYNAAVSGLNYAAARLEEYKEGLGPDSGEWPDSEKGKTLHITAYDFALFSALGALLERKIFCEGTLFSAPHRATEKGGGGGRY